VTKLFPRFLSEILSNYYTPQMLLRHIAHKSFFVEKRGPWHLRGLYTFHSCYAK